MLCLSGVRICATRGDLDVQKKLSRQQRREIVTRSHHLNRSVFLVQRPKTFVPDAGDVGIAGIPAAKQPNPVVSRYGTPLL